MALLHPPTRIATDTPARRLARLALRVLHVRRDLAGPPPAWDRPGFRREVELVRTHLRPLRTRAALAASFGREAFALAGEEVDPAALPGPVGVAYALRWLELGATAAGAAARPSALEER